MKVPTWCNARSVRRILLLIALGCLLTGSLAGIVFQSGSAAQDESLRLNPRHGSSATATSENPTWQGGWTTAPHPLTGKARQQLHAAPEAGGYAIESDGAQSRCRVATEEEASAMQGRNLELPLRAVTDEESAALAQPEARVQTGVGMKIILRTTPQLEQYPVAKAAFIRAAQHWESLIQTPITLVIDVDYGTTWFGVPYPNTKLLGQTSYQPAVGSTIYPEVRAALLARASSAQEATLDNMLPQSQIPTDLGSTAAIFAPAAVFRALGILDPVADPDGERANLGPPPAVGFNSAYQFDFDPSDGIAPDKFDFDATAIHEIGHALGFHSEVGETERAANQPLQASVQDLFRFRPGTTTTTFSTARRILSSGGEQVFFGGAPDIRLSTGRNDYTGGDGNQACHWKDEVLNGGQYIGIMHPIMDIGKRHEITDNDLKALDLMGYQLRSNPTPTPTPGPNQRTVELKLDDGTQETGAYGDGLIVVNRLTPPSYPATLQQLRLHFAQFQGLPDPTGKPITIVIFSDPSGAGQPPAGAQITRINTTVPGTDPSVFFDYNLSNGATINSGDFYVGVQAPSPHQGVGVFLDTSGQSPNRCFYSSNNGAGFSLLAPALNLNAANALIRAVVSIGGATPTPTPTPVPGGDTVALTSGVPRTGAIPTPNAGSALLGETQYTIQVPSGATQLKVTLSGNQDVDLFVRMGHRIEIQSGNIVADFKSESDSGNESLTITPGSTPALQAGTYSIAVGNFGPGAANFTLTATVTSGGNCGYTISPTTHNTPSAGGLGSVNVSTNAGCSWTATSNATFMQVLAPASGSGNGSITYAVAANPGANARTGTLTVAGQTVTVTQDGAGSSTGNRVVRIGQTSGSPGGAASVPIELVAQGDESALGFSLTFDPSVLSNPQVRLGSDAGGATLNANTTQIGSGRLGIALSLPFGQKFNAGTRQIVIVNFAIATNASGSSTPIGFGDQPTARELSDVNARALAANYTAGAVSFTSGFEADVAPRPNSDGKVTITDWVQIGRFVAGQDAPSAAELQRADCAPRESRGNGSLSITDWVQAGRYAAGLDAPTPAGGPNGFGGGVPGGAMAVRHQAAAASGARVMSISSGRFERGQQSAVMIELSAQGDENALGFSLWFDPAQLRFIAASTGRDAASATLNVNASQAAQGRLGLALALPAGQTLVAGQRQAIVVNFAVAVEGAATSATISFEDQPVARELADANARALPASFNGGTLILARSVASVSAASFTGQSLASEAIVAAFGQNLATQLAVAETLPLPTTLAGATVRVRDSAGEERLAPLFFVAPTQVNYQIPAGVAAGEATVTITAGDGQVSTGMINIAALAPGLFSASASGQGLAAAIVLRVKADSTQSYEPIAQYDARQQRLVALPIDLGDEGDQVFLLLFGTGFRHQRNLASVMVKLGRLETEALFAGPQGDFTGLDQLNLRIPRSLAGSGEVDVILNVDGYESNRVQIHIK